MRLPQWYGYFIMNKKKIWITGAQGMVGQSIDRFLLKTKKYLVLKTSRKDFDQSNQVKTKNWIVKNNPDIIIICSAMVGGIHLNSKKPADFLYENSIITLNIIKAAHEANCKKIVFLGASCMYPKNAKQPFSEESILNGEVEKTNEGYAIAKILGVKYLDFLNQQYGTKHISIIPTASYGPKDCYDESKNHVIPALIKRIHNAKTKNKKEAVIWGSGNAKREFIHVDDMANGIMHIIENYKENSPINLGSGEEVTIKKLSKIICNVIGYKGMLIFDKSKPDGVKRKILSNHKLKKIKWKSSISLEQGIKMSYEEFLTITKSL